MPLFSNVQLRLIVLAASMHTLAIFAIFAAIELKAKLPDVVTLAKVIDTGRYCVAFPISKVLVTLLPVAIFFARYH